MVKRWVRMQWTGLNEPGVQRSRRRETVTKMEAKTITETETETVTQTKTETITETKTEAVEKENPCCHQMGTSCLTCIE